MFLSMGLDGRFKSLSARRAWIEMHKEASYKPHRLSLSARRAWIEISSSTPAVRSQFSRSPQGERG